MTLLSQNPATGTLLRSYDALSAEAVKSKIAEAQLAFEEYSETSLEHRALWMKKLAGILEQEMEELATLLTMETGKTIRSSREEVLRCAACCRYFAEAAASLLEDETVEIDGNRCTTSWQPMGVLFAVMPGNSPFWQVFRVIVPALLGGNTVVLKHSANVPQAAVELELLLRRAGFARGVFQTLLMDAADIEIVLNDERIAGVAVGGMQQAGREVAAHTAWMGKKSVTDRQGVSSFIVMPSANLFAAIQAGVAARCLDNGQSNESTARFIVHESVYDEFALLFATAMEDVKVGNPLKDETELGPMASEENVRRLKTQIASALAAGGSVLTGGDVMLGDGNYFEPTVVVEVPEDAPVCREEIHGPVAMLFKVASASDAIRIANRACGTGVSVWTQDEREKQMLGRRLACGSVFMNSPMVLDARMAAGSLQGAGCGRTMAAASLHEFMSARTIVTASLIAGSEFAFDLSMAEFEKEAQLAEEAEEPKEETALAEFDPKELEDDLFVLSRVADIEPASAVPAEEEVEEASAPIAAAFRDEAHAEEVKDFVSVTSSVVVPEKLVFPKKILTLRNAVKLPAFSIPKKQIVTAQRLVAEPIPVEESVVIEHGVVGAADAAQQAAALSFKEMFERALTVRA